MRLLAFRRRVIERAVLHDRTSDREPASIPSESRRVGECLFQLGTRIQHAELTKHECVAMKRIAPRAMLQPVRSRNYLEFVLLAPGVTRSGRHTAPGGVTSTLQDSGFSFGGLRPRSNTLTIDGLDNNDEFTGSTRTELSLEFGREFQVVTNGWSVENGGASAEGDQRRDPSRE